MLLLSRVRIVSVVALIVITAPVHAQTTATTFTAEDALNINSYAVSDLTDDGRYLVVTNTLRRDSYGQDYRHDGDPTYTRGIPVRLLVIDTKSGAVSTAATITSRFNVASSSIWWL